jgi:hypothetical protein
MNPVHRWFQHVVLAAIAVAGAVHAEVLPPACREIQFMPEKYEVTLAGRLHSNLLLDFVTGDGARADNIVYDIAANTNGGTGKSVGGFGHPTCIETGSAAELPAKR